MVNKTPLRKTLVVARWGTHRGRPLVFNVQSSEGSEKAAQSVF